MPPSSSQQGLIAVNPCIPQTMQFVFHSIIGGFAGQVGECVRRVHNAMLREFVLAITFVQTSLFKDSGTKLSKTNWPPVTPGTPEASTRNTCGPFVTHDGAFVPTSVPPKASAP